MGHKPVCGHWSVRQGGKLGRGAAVVLVALAAGLIWVGAAAVAQPNEAYEAAVSSAGPAAWFRLNDAAGSSSIEDDGSHTYSAGNTGIVLGGAGPFRGSSSGSFNGEAYATLPSDPLLGASAFTVEGWVNWAGGSSYGQPVFEFGSGISNYMTLTPAASATKHALTLEIVTPSGSTSVLSTKFAEKTWEHVTVTESTAGKLALYLNGKEAAATTGASVSPASLGSSVPYDYLGHALALGVPQFHGSLSNIAFYTKALTSAQVEEHYDVAQAPVNFVSPSLEGETREGAILTAKEGSWSGLEPIKFTYAWQLCNSAEVCTSIAKATKSTLTLVSEDVDSTVRVTLTGSNATGISSSASSAHTTTVDGKPANTELPVISGEAGDGQEAKVGEELTVSAGSWRAFPPASLTYLWESCPKKNECAKAEGVTNEAGYRVTAPELGDTLRATVAAKNSLGEAAASSVATAKVVAGPPVDVSKPALEGEALEGEELKVSSPGTWAGTQPIEYVKYTWLRCREGTCHEDASGAKYTSYTTSAADVGYTIEVQVAARNSAGEASASSQPSAGIEAKPLRSTSPPKIAGEAREGQTLSVASPGSWEGEAPIEYVNYTWLVCREGKCQTIESGPSDTSYTLTQSNIGATIELQVTAKDPQAEQAALSAPSPVVVGNAPANTAAPTISGLAEDEQTLTSAPGEWTGTQALAYSYQWQRCNNGTCTAISGAQGEDYTVAHADVGDTIEVLVTATNSVGHESVSSPATAPAKPSAPVDAVPASIVEGLRGSLAFTADEGSWHGTPPIAYTYQWESCSALAGAGCLPIAGATEALYTPETTLSGDTLQVQITATNAAGESTTTASPSQRIQSTATTAVSWGENFYGQLGAIYRDTKEDNPIAAGPGLDAIAALSSGGTETLALLTDGDVAAWGNNPHGQLGDDSVIANREVDAGYVMVSALAGKTLQPLEHVQAVAASSEHAMALGANHWVYSWGNGAYGTLGNGHGGFEKELTQNEKVAEPVSALEADSPAEAGKEVVSVASGGGSDYALLKDGEVMAWGDNAAGQLGLGSEWPEGCKTVPRKSEDPSCVGYECHIEVGWEPCRATPEPVMAFGERLKDAKAIYAGQEGAYALVGNGELLSWGNDGKAQLSQEPKVVEAGPQTTFTQAGYVVRRSAAGGYERVNDIVEVSAGYNHVLVRRADGEVLGWGDNEKGELGEGGASPEICNKGNEVQCFKLAAPIKALEPYWTPSAQIEAVSAGGQFSDVLIDHEVYAFGDNEVGELGDGTNEGPERCSTPKEIQKEKEKIEAEEKEREEEGEEARKNPPQPRARWCSRQPLPVLQHGTLGASETTPLTGVRAISAGTNNSHTAALLESEHPQPAQFVNVEVKANAGKPTIKAGWDFLSPEMPARVLYRQYTGGAIAEPAEGEQSTNACEEQEAEGIEVECPVDTLPPHIKLDYEAPKEEDGKKPKSEGKNIPRVGEKVTLTSEGKWAGAAPISYEYQWELCGGEEEGGEGEEVEASECVPIAGASGAIGEHPSKEVHTYDYTFTKEDIGARVRVSIKAKNAVAEVSAVSAATQPVREKGEARSDKAEGGSLKGYPNPGSYEVTGYAGNSLQEGKVYEVKVSGADPTETGGWSNWRPRVLIVPIPEASEGPG